MTCSILSVLDKLPQVYFKVRLDSNKGSKKRGASFSQNNVLFKTGFFSYSTRQHLGVPFQHRGAVNSHMYLIVEVKSKGKAEPIDYVAMTVGELFAGNKYASHWLEMDNGGSVHVTMTCKEIETIPEEPARPSRSRLSFRQKKSSE